MPEEPEEPEEPGPWELEKVAEREALLATILLAGMLANDSDTPTETNISWAVRIAQKIIEKTAP